MKKGEIYEGIVESVEFPNKAAVRVVSDSAAAEGSRATDKCSAGGDTGTDKCSAEGSVVTVKNAIPGQKIRFLIHKNRRGKAEGRLLEVLEASPIETADTCQYFGLCGGCTYQSIAYEEQLKIKRGQVARLLQEAIRTDFVFEGILGSPVTEGYRNKMEFSFGDETKGGKPALGLHKRNSMYDIVTVEGCRIADRDFGKILMCVYRYFADKKIPYFHKVTHEGYLRHLLVRKAVKTGQILVDIVTSTQMQFEMEELGAMLQGLALDGKITGFLHTFNDSVADVVKNERTDIVFGRDYIEEELLGLHFRISPFSFFQTNSLGAEVLYAKAREYVGTTKDKVVFDLYSGTGTIAQILAPVAKKVIGVEIVEEAVAAARENARLNGLSNCEFIAGDVLKVLDGLSDKPDIIVLDPPRDGIHPKALEKIIAYGVEHLVYISCKPTSLARDLTVFQAHGYTVERVACVDMFPGTVHVETVCLLSNRKSKPDTHVKLSLSMDDYYRIKEEGKNNQ